LQYPERQTGDGSKTLEDNPFSHQIAAIRGFRACVQKALTPARGRVPVGSLGAMIARDCAKVFRAALSNVKYSATIAYENIWQFIDNRGENCRAFAHIRARRI